MRRARAAALLLVLAAVPAASQGAPDAEREKLANDPAAVDVLAERIARSRLIERLTADPDHGARLAAAKDWINSDPAAAERVAIGLARDDASGTSNYENALLTPAKSYEPNPGAERNLFGRLRKTAKDSKLLQKQSEDISNDEKREILRTIFEGKGAESDKVLTGKADGKAPSGAPSATAFNGLYDRLSAGNLRGYSPQLLALQSALSARRPPGAPALVETGKLDHATLAYPAYALSYDVVNLEKRRRQDRILALARLAGRTIGARDWEDPDLEMKLAARVPAGKMSPRLARRDELVAKARAALAAFSASAAKAKDPGAITRGLLIELGAKQKETARWIAAAALEEELSRLEPLENFPTPGLLAAIDAVPVAAAERAAYKHRGMTLKAKVAAVKANAGNALGLLESDAWAGALAEIDRLVAETRSLKRDLGRDVEDFSRVPFLIAESLLPQPRWREWLDDSAVKWAPSLPYSRDVTSRRGRLARALNAFGLIASDQPDAAHATLDTAMPTASGRTMLSP